MKCPSSEELWLLCLKGKCVNVNDSGLVLLQNSFHKFFKKLLSISTTLAEHNHRATITSHDIIQSQEVLFRQRENDTIRMSGYLLNTTVIDEQSEDMDVSFEDTDTSSVSPSSDSDSDSKDTTASDTHVEEEQKVGLTSDMREELKTTFEIESEGDIDDIENDPAQKKLIRSGLISSKSYLHLFKDTSKTKFITAEAFNMLTGVCEHQVQLNLQGEDSLVQVVFDGMIVPISIVMKLTTQQEEMEAVTLKSKYLGVENECLVSLAESRNHQKDLLGVLKNLLISTTSSTSSSGGGGDVGSSSSSQQQQDATPSMSSSDHSALHKRLAEAETQTSFLQEQLQDARKKMRRLQDVVSEANEVAFSLRELTSPQSLPPPQTLGSAGIIATSQSTASPVPEATTEQKKGGEETKT